MTVIKQQMNDNFTAIHNKFIDMEIKLKIYFNK
jgi:hypothetical protein